MTGASSAVLSQQRRYWQRAYWLCQYGGWALYGVAGAVAASLVADIPWVRSTLEMLVMSAMGLGLTHFLHLLIQRRQWRRWRLRAR